jgi:hypothetical protein
VDYLLKPLDPEQVNRLLAYLRPCEVGSFPSSGGQANGVPTDRAKAIAPQQILGPAISEAAEPRCSTPSAIRLPDTPRWSEARPR